MPPKDQRTPRLTTEVTAEEIREQFERIPKKVEDELERLDIPRDYPKVKDPDTGQYFKGILPASPHRLSDDELGRYLSLVVGFTDRMSELEAKYKIEKKTTSEIAKKIFAEVKRKLTGSNPEKDQKASLDRRVIEAEAEALYYASVHDNIYRAVDRGNRNYTLLSRLISQRESSDSAKFRVGSVGAQRRPWGQKEDR